ncbi:magnesium and cobalt transport protein CorA [Antribacter sp. KLBMP9083]|uniref:Magnesium and cobalt transport protein CorA n=1 Tax=Antribacter soli TaxID=2910976 RepID=A0AA41QI03_9MICO|nr:magnesium and cobalt transport protein CorA [Antribacter soli]MCF4122502.1 magnesium and cobalt transport protein CorA [Antribacter soli]
MIGDCGVYVDGRRRPGRVPLDQAAEAARTASGFVWIGLQQPTSEEIAVVAEEFGLPALAVEDAVKAHQRPKLEVYGSVVFMVLKPVRYVDHEEVIDVSEIALFLGRDFVVTVRHGDSDVLGRVRAELDSGDSKPVVDGPTAVVYRAADLVVDGYEEAIVSITEDIDEIESQVFGGDGGEDHAERIYKLKREVAEFRRAVLPLNAPLRQLAEGSIPVVDKAAAPYFRDVHDHALRASDGIEGHDRLLSDVLQADLARVGVRHSKIAVRQNADMRRISAWAAIALVPTAIAGIYGMNFEYMPELTWRFGYFAVVGVVVSLCAGLYWLFRRSGWL